MTVERILAGEGFGFFAWLLSSCCFFFFSPTLAAQRPRKTETQATSVCHLFSYSRAATEGLRRRGQTWRGETQCTKLRHRDKINLITKISLFQVTAQTKQPHMSSRHFLFVFFIEGESAWKFRKEIPPLPTFTGSVIIRQTASALPRPFAGRPCGNFPGVSVSQLCLQCALA